MKKMIDMIKFGLSKSNKNEQLSVAVVCVLISATIYDGINHFIHTDSFIVETCVNLVIIYLLISGYFLIKGIRNEKG